MQVATDCLPNDTEPKANKAWAVLTSEPKTEIKLSQTGLISAEERRK
jgi:hypothetical protein